MTNPIAELAKLLPGQWDVVVGIPRGGLIVAAGLAYQLGVKNVGALTIEYERDEDDLAHPTGRILCAPVLGDGERVLLVEDGYTTGRLINLGRRWCESAGAEVEVVTAALRVTQSALTRPDVWLEEVDALPSAQTLLAHFSEHSKCPQDKVMEEQ